MRVHVYVIKVKVGFLQVLRDLSACVCVCARVCVCV